MIDTPFNRIAEVFSRVRPSYPERIYEIIRDYAGVERFETAVDLGSGGGASLEGLKAIAKKITGIEPGDRLRAEARGKFPDIEILGGQAEETGLESGSADLVTCATAFHWFDRRATLREIHRILKPGGTLAVFGYFFPILAGSGHVVINRHDLWHWKEYKAPELMRYDDKFEVIEASGLFEGLARDYVMSSFTHTVDSVVEFFSSTSYASSYMATLDKPEEYLARLRDEIAAVQPEPFEVAFDLDMVLARKAG